MKKIFSIIVALLLITKVQSQILSISSGVNSGSLSTYSEHKTIPNYYLKVNNYYTKSNIGLGFNMNYEHKIS